MLGNSTTCVLRKASDNISLCYLKTSNPTACKTRYCSDDGASTTDAQCKAFMEGCVTNGSGCIPSTEPCSSYKGDQVRCSAFTGNSKKCWNSIGSTSTSSCRDKTCVDDITSTTDQSCALTATDCVTKGIGCLPASFSCSAYVGT